MKVYLPLNHLAILSAAAILAACSNGQIKSGDRDFENLSYNKAAQKYEKALKKQEDNIDLKLKLADTYGQLNQSDKAEMFYREVADSVELSGEDKLKYAQALMKNNKYEEAKPMLQAYLNEYPGDQLATDLLASTNKVEQLKEDTAAYSLDALPLDFMVSMFGAIPYADGIVFAGETEIISAASANPWTGYSFLDMYLMKKDKEGNWDVPENFSTELNGKFHDGPAAFNGAQDMMVYTRSAMKNERKQLVNEKNENQFYLYSSGKTDGKWSAPQPMPFNNETYSVGHPTLTKDGKTMYFASDLPGGYGNSDIYKSTFDGTSWSEPINLGKTINTPGHEAFPNITESGKLYFASEGHLTLGGLDVFVSENRGGIWSAPVNLAYPLNSSQDDFALVMLPGDSTGYVSSNRSGVDMIYEWREVTASFVVRGLASSKSTGAPIDGVSIKLINLTDGDSAVVATKADGKFNFNLEPSKKYKVIGSKPGYFSVSQDFATGLTSVEKELQLKFDIDEIVASESGTGSGTPKDGSATAPKTYNIGDIFYDYNSATVRPDAVGNLDKLVSMLKDNPAIAIEIQSHSDSRGSDGYNMSLSNKRAQSVVNYLTAKGIASKRLKAKGFGESQPVNKCVDGVECAESEHQKNRRTEFIVLNDTKL